MTHREIVDDDGTIWELWEVHPTLADRRRAKDPHPPTESDERRKERRPVRGAMKSGWLAAQSLTERRRIAPVPEGWALRTDDELRELVRGKEGTGKRRRAVE